MKVSNSTRAATALPEASLKLTPLQRLERLCDPGSLRTFRTAVASRSEKRSQPGDGVLAGTGTVSARPVFCYAQDSGFAGGSLGRAQADTIARTIRMAADSGAPVVGFVESGGARMDEGSGALGGYGRIFREHVAARGRIPQVTVVCGPSAGGGSYSPALTDFVVMTEAASMFLTGPAVVAEVMGEQVSMAELGGPRVQCANGVAQLTAAGDAEGAALARELLSYLPQSAAGEAPITIPVPPAVADPAARVPAESRRVYDVRDVVRAIADRGTILELGPRWARNMVTCLARLEGRAVGVIANQPRHLGGVIDAAASEKGEWFVDRCAAFGLPLIVLVDTPGFLPGTRQEAAGVIRHGAGLLRAFAAARVPKVTVVLRKGYGGGFITMNSRDLGADLVLAWRDAQIGVVGPKQAVGIVHRKEIAAAADPDAEQARLAEAYGATHGSAAAAAAEGIVDELIDPAVTRDRLAWALATLTGNRRAPRWD